MGDTVEITCDECKKSIGFIDARKWYSDKEYLCFRCFYDAADRAATNVKEEKPNDTDN